ncbi:MAG: endo alpha-1,4 polygalactosaminidase [Thermomicrobiales bacterium]
MTLWLASFIVLASFAHQGGATPPPEAEWWQPAPGTSWQIQLDGELDTSFDVAVYDVDLFDTPTATIDALHADGRRVICYFSAGSWEEWRPDAEEFPAEAIGEPVADWPGEWWLDVRHERVRDLLQARLDLAAEKGCDGVDPDWLHVYEFGEDATGFPLTAEEQLDFNVFLAAAAHERGLAIGLKNNIYQVDALVAHFDWELNEECFQYDECDLLLPFIEAGKPVFQIEYGPPSLATEVCPRAAALGFDTLIKNLELDAPRTACGE